MPAFVELVEVDQLRIRLLCPTPWSLDTVVREDTHGSRNGDAFRKKETLFSKALPIEARAGNRGVRQPGKRDVVEDIVSGKAFGLPVKDA